MFALIILTPLSIAHADTPDTNIINIYDSNGSLVTGDGHYYEYNDANQLVRVRQGDQNGAVVAEYFYDYSGQRIKKIENGVVTYYIGKHFEKQIGGTEEGNSSYYFAEGERVAKKDPSGNIYFYHSDHLGGTNAVTDSAGNVLARADYLPFGEVKQGSTGNEKYSYTGKEKDKTDLYYFEARYNSTMFKHFTQADVASPDLSDPQDLNRYSYVGNNPMSYVDPDGFKKKKKSKKKPHLSKREKWMIAHGIDPDHDKTSLKKAKKQFKEGKKYTTASKSKTSKVSSSTYSLAGVGTVQGNIDTSTIKRASRRDDLLNRMNAEAAYYGARAKRYCLNGNNCLSTKTDQTAAWGTGPGTELLQEQGPLFGWINEHAKRTTNFSASWHEASNYWLTGKLPEKLHPEVWSNAATLIFVNQALIEGVLTELSDDD